MVKTYLRGMLDSSSTAGVASEEFSDCPLKALAAKDSSATPKN